MAPEEKVEEVEEIAQPVVEITEPEVEEVVESAPEETQTEEPKPDPVSEVLKKVEELTNSLKERDSRIEALEGKLKEPKPEEKNPEASKSGEHIKAFVNQFLPKAKEYFSNEDSTEKDRFDVMVEVADKMLGSVLADNILPGLTILAERLTEVSNRIEAAELSSADPEFSGLKEEVLGILKKLPLKDREKPDAVSSIYGQLKGKMVKKTPEKKTTQKEVLKDVGGGSNGSGSGKGVVVLSADQEEDRKQISLEAGHDMSPADYKIKYDAKVKYYKSQGKKVPATLRDF